jgi:hypothetical protein
MVHQPGKVWKFAWLFGRVIAVALFMCALLVPVVSAKITVDFDPNLDFSKFKTFAYIGGTNTLEFKQLNPQYISDRVHEGISQALVKRGLRELKPEEHPDLMVRYWANSQSGVAMPAAGSWIQFGPYTSDYWAYHYDLMRAQLTLEGSLTIDLIDVARKDLAWRVYLEEKIVDDDSIWPRVTSEISKGFESYPPSKKQIGEKKKERAEHPPKSGAAQ